MKPIIMITDEFFPVRAGIALVAEGLAHALLEEGFSLELWCPRHDELDSKRYPFIVRGIEMKVGQKLKSRKQLASFLRSNAEVLQSNRVLLVAPGPIRTFMEAKRWKISLPAQLDIVFHGNEIPRLTKTENDRKSLHRLLVQAGSITCVSSFGKNMLKKIFPELSDKIHIIHPGFRSDLKTDFKIERARREIFRILTVARIVPVKGHLAMIRSLGCLSRPIRRQIEYRLVGPVSFRPFLWFLKSMALWHGVRMIWQGSLDSEGLIREYQEADIFALTSVPFMGRAEAFPLVYLEAGLFCLPLVGHQIGGVGDIIIDGETGFLCKINQPKELSDRILLLMNDEDLRKKMGLSAHERSKQFTWKRFVSELYPEAVDLLSQKQKVARV